MMPLLPLLDVISVRNATTDETVAEDIPAYVGYKTVALEGGDVIYETETLLVIVEPLDMEWRPSQYVVIWDGTEWQSRTPPMVRRVAGVDHHWTLELKRYTGTG